MKVIIKNNLLYLYVCAIYIYIYINKRIEYYFKVDQFTLENNLLIQYKLHALAPVDSVLDLVQTTRSYSSSQCTIFSTNYTLLPQQSAYQIQYKLHAVTPVVSVLDLVQTTRSYPSSQRTRFSTNYTLLPQQSVYQIQYKLHALTLVATSLLFIVIDNWR